MTREDEIKRDREDGLLSLEEFAMAVIECAKSMTADGREVKIVRDGLITIEEARRLAEVPLREGESMAARIQFLQELVEGTKDICSECGREME